MKERIQNIKTLFGSQKKVISILSVIAMVLSVFITPLMDLPAGRSPGTGKVYAAENLTGTAYAVFNSDTGELDFIRSTESHKNGDTGTIKNIDGKSFTGTIYTGFEKNTKNYNATPGWFDYPSPWRDVIEQVKIVKFIDNIKPTTTAAWFAGMKNCTSMDLKKLITSQTVDMSYMFGKGGENWLGDGCTSLTALDVSNFDTSKVTNMSHMFEGCSKLTSLDLSKFNTGNVTDMSYMFSDCSKLTSLDLSGFNTSNVTEMGDMFSDCGLTSLDLSGFNTSNVTGMGDMFKGCSGLTSLDVSKFNTSNVTYMGSMFEDCSKLTSLDVSKFDTSKVTSMGDMFKGCSGLTSLDVSGFNTSNVTGIGMYEMFSGCSGLTSLDVSKFNTSNVTSMREMFGGCSKLTALDVSNFDTSKVTDMHNMFGTSSSVYFGKGCSSLESLDVSKFNTSNVTDMSGMFQGCSKLKVLDLSNFDTSKVTNMNHMFGLDTTFSPDGCSSLKSLDVSKFNTSNVTDMNNMFSGCSGLTSLDLSKFNTSNVIDMNSMFSECSGLTSLDVSSFDTSKIGDNEYYHNMSLMFYNCSSLYKLIIGKSFKVSPLHSERVFSSPARTISGKSSDGTWGLGSEHAAKTYTADELITLGKTAGALAGTWYAQAAGTYAIKFDPNGGSGTMANETMTVGGTQPLTANTFTRTGYLLKSWNTKQDGSGTSYADKASVKDLGTKGSTVTLYAQWEPKTYKNTISHWLYGFKNQEGNNGSKDAFYLGDSFFEGVFGKGTTLDSSKGITLPNGISLSNYLGYNDPTTGKWVSSTIPNTVTQPDKAMAYQLNYSPIAYKLTYNLLGGSNDSANPSSYNVLYGVTLKDAKRTGYTFSGWTDSSGKKVTGINEGANATFSSADDLYSKLAARLTGDITLNANWTANDYTVKFSANGGTETMADEGMTYDTSKALTANSFKKTGYTFTGWNTKADGSGTSYSDKASVKNLATSGTATLYAQWKIQSHTLTIDPDGGTWGGSTGKSKVTQNYNTQRTIEAPTRSGYTFVGWATTGNGTMAGETSDNAFANNKWQANSVAYDNEKSGANSIFTETAEVDNPLKIKGVTKYQGVFKNDGSKETKPQLGGWLVKENSSANSRHIVSFIAKIPKGYYAHYNNNSLGTGGDIKWLTPNAGTGEWTTYAYKVYGGAEGTFGTLKDFGYTQISKSKDRTNDPAHGAVTVKVAAESIMNVTLSTTKTYTFGDSDGTLTALWVPNTHKATMDNQGATTEGTKNIWWFTNTTSLYNGKTSWYYEDERTEKVLGRNSTAYPNYQMTIPKKTGYTFGGYFTGKNGTGTQYTSKDGAMINSLYKQDSDMTLYAQWTPNTYTVKFDPNRGTGTMANETMTYDTAKTLPANSFTNKDYDFIGWNTKADGSGAFYTDKASVKNLASSGTVMLYAQWNYNPHVFLPKSGGKGIITLTLVSAFCILAYAEREILKKRKEVR